MIDTKKLFWAAKPINMLTGATLYNSVKGTALTGDLFVYKEMLIFCAYAVTEEKRPIQPEECCVVYAAGYSDCFARNGVFVLDQAQQTVTINKYAQKRMGMLEMCGVPA